MLTLLYTPGTITAVTDTTTVTVKVTTTYPQLQTTICKLMVDLDIADPGYFIIHEKDFAAFIDTFEMQNYLAGIKFDDRPPIEKLEYLYGFPVVILKQL